MTFSGRPAGNLSDQITQRELRAYEERDEARAELKRLLTPDRTGYVQVPVDMIQSYRAQCLEARAIARRLATMVRLFVTVAPSTEYEAEHTLREFDALPWAKDDDA